MLVLAIAGAAFLATGASAASIVVNSAADGAPSNNGLCTLREAILNANANAQSGSTDCAAGNGADTVTFSVAGPIVLSSSLPAVTGNLTVTGPGMQISGANTYRIFTVSAGKTLNLNGLVISNGFSAISDGGAIYNSGTLNVKGCTFSNNSTTSSWSGGAIVSYGPLTITDSEFAGNSGGNGGAIYPRFSPAKTTITGSSFHDNVTTSTDTGWGGAMLLWGAVSLTIDQSTLNDNTSRAGGGAIYAQSGSSVTITDSTLSGNRTTKLAAGGGAFFTEGDATVTRTEFASNYGDYGGALRGDLGTITIAASSFHDNWGSIGGALYTLGNVVATDSTFEHNGYDDQGATVTGNGGAITVVSGTLLVERCTLVDNWGSGGGGIFQFGGATTLRNSTISYNDANFGGGIYTGGGTVDLTNSTVFRNRGAVSGAGIQTDGTVTARNSIVADNDGSGNCTAAVSSAFFCLSSDATCGFGAGRDNVAVNLAGLGDYGGSTPTNPPLAGSPAIDAGTGTGCPAIDQRGAARPVGLACDVGAVERQAADTDPAPSQPDATIDGVGAGIFNKTTDGQSTKRRVARGATATFVIEIRNAGSITNDYAVHGAASADPVAVTYLEGATGATDITAAVTAGTYAVTKLLPGASRVIRMKVDVNPAAVVGTVRRFRIETRSKAGIGAVDFVRGKVRVTAS